MQTSILKTISKNIKQFAFVAILLFFPEVLFGLENINLRSNINSRIRNFEASNSTSSAIIINARTGKIEFVYNPDFAFRKKFPPGSIAKTWSAVILLESQTTNNENLSTYLCNGKFQMPDGKNFSKGDLQTFNLPEFKNQNYFKCSLSNGHGHMNIQDALIHSCNAYFLNAAIKNPQFYYKRLLEKWKLLETTGANLNGYYELPGKMHMLSDFQAAAALIGEGGSILVSPLKVAQTYAAFFLQTPLLVPHTKPQNSRVQYPLNIPGPIFQKVYYALKNAIKNGTLKNLNIKNNAIQVIAGKTGSATHENKKYKTHAWNVILFRLQNVDYVLVTFIYKGYGGKEARKLSELILNQL